MKMIRKLLCVSLALILCLCAASPLASAEMPGWVGAYRAVLDGLMLRAAEESEALYSSMECSYALYDIDKDGVPELIVKLGTCEADYHGEIYGYADGQARLMLDELGLGHSSLYSDPGENGVIVMYGHMGYASAYRMRLDGNWEMLYEDDLNARLQNDPDAEYVYPGDVIPGSAALPLCRAELSLPLTHYEEIAAVLCGNYPTAAEKRFPENNTAFFENWMSGNREAYAVTADGYTNSPGYIGFLELLRQNVAAEYMDGDMKILGYDYADLNGDGQLECLVTASRDYAEMCIILSEQNGTVYAYLNNYTENWKAQENGNILVDSPYYRYAWRLIFDGAEAFLMSVPTD